MLRALPTDFFKKGLMSRTSTIRCRSGGRIRNFIRNRVLLMRWQPRALPDAPNRLAADESLDSLVGATLRHGLEAALAQADLLAGRIGGCARDAYTVLYGCAALAVLFAAIGSSIGGAGLIIKAMIAAELLTLGVLFVTFQQAHSVNWHGRWLGLRFHAEFLRCVPLLAMLREERAAGWLVRHQAQAGAHDHDPEHLRALRHEHHDSVDERSVGHEQRQQQVRDELFGQLHQRYRDDPQRYARGCLAHAHLLARQQQRYHCLRAQQERAIVHRTHTLSIAGFSLTIVAVLLHTWWHAPLLTVVSTGVPAFAAALHGFVAQEESERLAASSQAMARRLHAWLDEVRIDGGDLEETQAALYRLVKLMMSDVQDWHRLFGDKGMYHLG